MIYGLAWAWTIDTGQTTQWWKYLIYIFCPPPILTNIQISNASLRLEHFQCAGKNTIHGRGGGSVRWPRSTMCRALFILFFPSKAKFPGQRYCLNPKETNIHPKYPISKYTRGEKASASCFRLIWMNYQLYSLLRTDHSVNKRAALSTAQRCRNYMSLCSKSFFWALRECDSLQNQGNHTLCWRYLLTGSFTTQTTMEHGKTWLSSGCGFRRG